MYRLIAGTSAVAGVSFLLGRYSKDENVSIIRNLHAATAQELKPIGMTYQSYPVNDGNKALTPVNNCFLYGKPEKMHIQHYPNYVIGYDQQTKTASWVSEHLVPEQLAKNALVTREQSEFVPNSQVFSSFRSENSDYLGSGYDRGHLAAAGNYRNNQEYMNNTFDLANISPQVGKGFNRDKWNELEMYCRKVAKKAVNTYVMTGPLYMPKYGEDGKKYVKYEVIGKNNVAVPTHFFKVLLIEVKPGKFELESYILPNEVIPDSTELSTFLQPLEAIEKTAGFRIFEKLSPKAFQKINKKSNKSSFFF